MTEVMLLFAILLIVPLLFGAAVLEPVMLKKKADNNVKADNAVLYMMGLLLMFALFEGVAVVGIKINLTLKTTASVFMGICCLLVMVSLFVSRKRIAQAFDAVRLSLRLGLLKIILWALLVCVFYFIWILPAYSDAHTIEETVLTTLYTDSLYEYNPLTGVIMGNGMYPINQLCTAPLFDATLITVTGISQEAFLKLFLPLFVAGIHFLVVWLWARECEKPYVFMIAYVFIFVCSMNLKEMGAFSLFRSGISGNVFVVRVLLPFLVYMIWRGRKWYGKWGYGVVTVLGLAAIAMQTNLTTVSEAFFIGEYVGIERPLLILLLFAVYLIANNMISWKWIVLMAGALVSGMTIMLLAYMTVGMVAKLRNLRKRDGVIIGLLFAVLLITFTGFDGRGIVLSNRKQVTAEEKILNEVLNYMEETGNDSIKLAAPREIMGQARKKSASVILPFGRDYWNPSVNKEIGDIYDDEAYALYANLVDMKDLIDKDTVLTPENEEHLIRVASLSKDNGCDVFVTTATMPESGYARLIVEIDGYFLYSVVK